MNLFRSSFIGITIVNLLVVFFVVGCGIFGVFDNPLDPESSNYVDPSNIVGDDSSSDEQTDTTPPEDNTPPDTPPDDPPAMQSYNINDLNGFSEHGILSGDVVSYYPDKSGFTWYFNEPSDYNNFSFLYKDLTEINEFELKGKIRWNHEGCGAATIQFTTSIAETDFDYTQERVFFFKESIAILYWASNDPDGWFYVYKAENGERTLIGTYYTFSDQGTFYYKFARAGDAVTITLYPDDTFNDTNKLYSWSFSDNRKFKYFIPLSSGLDQGPESWDNAQGEYYWLDLIWWY